MTYTANEVNGLINPQAYHDDFDERRLTTPDGTPIDVYWDEPGLRITRLRLLTERGFPLLDVSYCHGELDGKTVRVQLPFHQLPRKGTHRAIIEHAKRDGVFAKGTGILDAISILFG